MSDEIESTQADPSDTVAASTEAAAGTETDTASAGAASESSQEGTAGESGATAATETETSAEATQEQGSEGASDAAESADSDVSRTGFVDKGVPGDECICPDGRKGTIFGDGSRLVCIPNQDQA